MVSEDFYDYTEVDFNNYITINSAVEFIFHCQRNKNNYLWIDRDPGGIPTDFKFENSVQVTLHDHTSLAPTFAVADDLGGLNAMWGTDNVEMCWSRHYYTATGPGRRISIGGHDGVIGDVETLDNAWTDNIEFFLTYQKVGAIFSVKVYTDEARTILQGSISVDCGEFDTYRYLYACGAWNTGGAPDMIVTIRDFDEPSAGDGSEDLAAGFIVRQSGSEELLGELVVRQPGSVNLLAGFTVGQPGSEELPAAFEVGLGSQEELLGELIVVHASTLITSDTPLLTDKIFQRQTFYAKARHWAFYNEAAQIYYKTSLDGINWSAGILIFNHHISDGFSLSWDGTYLHWAGAEDILNVAIFYRRGIPNADGSITWTTALRQTAVPADPAARYNYPVIIVDSEGYPWIGWRQQDAGGFFPYVIKSDNNDGTWSGTETPVQLDAGSSSLWRVQLVPLNAERVYVLKNIGSNANTEGRLWDSGWGGWEDLGFETSGAGYLSAVSRVNDVFIAFTKDNQDITFIRRTWGVGWGLEIEIYDPLLQGPPCALAKGAVDSDFYVFWGPNNNSPTAHHVFYSKSEDYGATWTAPIDLIDESENEFSGTTSLNVAYEQGVDLISIEYTRNFPQPGAFDWQARYSFLDGLPQVASGELGAKFEVGQGAADLPAEFIVMPIVSEELLGEFVVRQPGSQELLGEFSIRRSALQELLGELIVRHPGSVDLVGGFIVRQAGSENLLGKIIVRHSSLQELAAGFAVRHTATPLELKAGFLVAIYSADLIANIYVRPTTSRATDFVVKDNTRGLTVRDVDRTMTVTAGRRMRVK